jgi:hypothetical protein
MNCKICGAPIAEGQEFCEDCRARHTSATPAEIVPETGKAHGRAAKISGIVALVLSLISEIAWGIGYGLIIMAFAAIDTKDGPAIIPKATGDSMVLGGNIATVITAVIWKKAANTPMMALTMIATAVQLHLQLQFRIDMDSHLP